MSGGVIGSAPLEAAGMEYITSYTAANAASYTFTDCDLGAAGRGPNVKSVLVFVTYFTNTTNSAGLSSPTIGGVSATSLAASNWAEAGSPLRYSLVVAFAANVDAAVGDVTFSDTAAVGCQIHIVRAVNLDTTSAYGTRIFIPASTGNIAVPAGGYICALGDYNRSGGVTTNSATNLTTLSSSNASPDGYLFAGDLYGSAATVSMNWTLSSTVNAKFIGQALSFAGV